MQIEKEEQAAAEKAVGKEEFQGEWSAPVADIAQLEVPDWSEGVQVPSVPIQQFPAGIEGKQHQPLTTDRHMHSLTMCSDMRMEFLQQPFIQF